MKNLTVVEKGFVLASQAGYAPALPKKDEWIAAYFQWLEKEGLALIQNLLAGETIPEEWLRLVKGSCIWRGDRTKRRRDQGFDPSADEAACIAYVEQLENEGAELMRRGYFGETFNESETERLWEYRLLAEVRVLGLPVWPYELGIHERSTPQKHLTPGDHPFDPGWRTMESAFSDPDYDDAGSRDIFLIMKPEAVDLFTTRFAGYEPHEDENGRRYVVPRATKREGVRLADFRGKPVVLFVAAATDCFWPRCAQAAETLHQAYGDRVEFLWVNIRLFDFFIRSITAQNYFKPDAGYELVRQALTDADRARLAKKVYMTLPQVSFPCVLDDVSDTTANAFRSGGGGAMTVLINRCGRVVKQRSGWGFWNISRPAGHGDYVPWTDALERDLCALLALGENEVPEQENSDTQDKTLDQNNLPEGVKQMWAMSSPVTAVNKEDKTFTVNVRPDATFTVCPPPTDQPDPFNPRKEIVVQMEEKSSLRVNNGPIILSELRVGDSVGGTFWKMPDGRWIARIVNVWPTEPERFPKKASPFVGNIFMCGEILSVKNETVTMMQTLTDDLPGMKFIEEAGERVELFGPAKENYEAVARWQENGPCEFTFRPDENGWITLNGEPAKLDALKPGDLLAVRYDTAEESLPEIRAELLRATRP